MCGKPLVRRPQGDGAASTSLTYAILEGQYGLRTGEDFPQQGRVERFDKAQVVQAHPLALLVGEQGDRLACHGEHGSYRDHGDVSLRAEAASLSERHCFLRRSVVLGLSARIPDGNGTAIVTGRPSAGRRAVRSHWRGR